jgi:hypothetical protein
MNLTVLIFIYPYVAFKYVITPMCVVCIHVTLTLGLNYKSAELAVLKHSIKYYLILTVVMQIIKYIQRDLPMNSIHTIKMNILCGQALQVKCFLELKL